MVSIELLGQQRVATGDVAIDAFPTQRTVGLLAHLLLHAGSEVPRTHLAGCFWPESTEAQARTNLRRELHHLRRALPDPDALLDSDAVMIRWRRDGPFTADVTEFIDAAAEASGAVARPGGAADDAATDRFIDAAERAVLVYGGPLLPGHYEDWVLESRDELHRTCLQLLDQLVERLRDADELVRAIPHARRRVELEPLEELGHRVLMELYAAVGDRAAAVRSFHRCATVMQRELGLDPSPTTVELYRSLTASGDPAAVELGTAEPPLVGRDAELAVLDDLRQRSGDRPRIVVVRGEAGVGKTRLVDEFAARVEGSGARVARARCYASAGEAPLAPVVAWLRSPALGDAVDALRGTAREEASLLLPELATSPVPIRGDRWRQRRLLEALARPLLDSAVPTVLVLDDLQWSDPETIEWLGLLPTQVSRAPLTVVATARAEDLGPGDPLEVHLHSWRLAGVVDELELAPLTTDAVAVLARWLLADGLDEVRLERLVARTGGNPLFVAETLRGVPIGSSRTEAVLAARLDRLGPAARELVVLMACWGRDATVELLESASGLDHDVVVEALDELWRRRLVRAGAGGTYDLVHDLFRTTAYRRLSPPQQALRHRRLAEALRQEPAEDGVATSARLADQFARGGRPRDALGHHRAAASAAAAVHAYATALGHHRAALELLDVLGVTDTPERARLLTEVGLAERDLGDPGHETTLLDAAELARRVGDPVTAAFAVMGVGQRGFWSASFSGEPRRAECAAAVLERFDAASDPPRPLHARLLALVAMDLHFAERSREACELLGRAEGLARCLDHPEPLLDVLATRTLAGLGPDTAPAMHEVARECVELAGRLDDPLRLSHEYRRLAVHLRRVGRVREARRIGERAVAVAAGLDHGPTDYWLADLRVVDALQSGDGASARRHRDEAARIGRRIGFGDTEARVQHATFVIHLLEGTPERLAAQLAPMLSEASTPAPLRAGAAVCLAADGRADAARDALSELVDELGCRDRNNSWLLVAVLAARAVHLLGEPGVATSLLEVLDPCPPSVVLAGPAVFGTTEQALGLAAVAAGDPARAVTHLGRAAAFERRAAMDGWRVLSEQELERVGPVG